LYYFLFHQLAKMKVEPTLSGSGGIKSDISHLIVPMKRVDSVPSNPFYKKKIVAKQEGEPKVNADKEVDPDEIDHQSLESSHSHRNCSEDKTGP
jgi:hypothetical protein